MAQRMEHFPAEQRRPTRRYPWDEWADGSVWKLVRGEDFDAEADQFRNRLYPQATRRGLAVRSAKRLETVDPETGKDLPSPREILIVQFYEPNGSAPAAEEFED